MWLIASIIRTFLDAEKAKKEAREEKYRKVRVRQLLEDTERRRDEHARLRRPADARPS